MSKVWTDNNSLLENEFWLAATKDNNFQALLAGLKEQKFTAHLYGLNEGLKIYLYAQLLQHCEHSAILLYPDESTLREYQVNLIQLLPQQEFFHLREREENDYSPRKSGSFNNLEFERIYILYKLALKEKIFVLSSAKTLLQILPSPQDLIVDILYLDLKKKLNLSDLNSDLISRAYRRRNVVEEEACFSVRGDIVDICPIGFKYEIFSFLDKDEQANLYRLLSEEHIGSDSLALRLSFFDDEIDEIKLFNMQNQRSLCNLKLNKLRIFPAAEILWPLQKQKKESLQQKILAIIEEHKGVKQVYKLKDDLENLNPDWFLQEFFASSLQEYMQDNLILIDDIVNIRPNLDKLYTDFVKKIQNNILHKNVLPTLVYNRLNPVRVFTSLDCCSYLISFNHLKPGMKLLPSYRENLPNSDTEDFKYDKTSSEKEIRYFDFQAKDLPVFSKSENKLKENILFLDNLLKKDDQLFIFDWDKFNLIKEDRDLLPKYLNFFHHAINNADVLIKDGFYYPGASLAYLSYSNFSFLKKEKGGHKQFRHSPNDRQKNYERAMKLFADLKAGDYVVHEQHGIAIYEGLTSLSRNGVKRDYLKLRYAKDDSLFIPMEALNQVQKYIGIASDLDKKPKLSRLGGGDWQKLKDRARESGKALALNLVQLYARRMQNKGFAFQADTVWEKEFAQAFEFEETQDQLRCIAEIEQDMCSDKSMDRLLCGDVGFGKTEVAFRAIFKCISNSKQAILVSPTTVLCQQHFETLSKRLSSYPVKIVQLSRFVDEKTKKRNLLSLASGEADILVATHSAFSKKINFKDPGLLVIDEEQRFGVNHKEYIKEKYPHIDVLSLSATPIPRSLHMSLAGIRDISLLQEAPYNRRPIMTYVLPYDEDMICEAVDREIARQGQVFYLFNNTHKIDEKAEYLQKLMPNVRIAVAHARMNETHLENIIRDFMQGSYDLLLCTTIIESGIDMPEVNTIIVEHGERLGMAQLYQLRGRVGRSYRQAYAYITYPEDLALSEQASNRLAAIRDYTDLGSGFKIALRDLETRGAGNVLGAEQHGQLEAVGYDLYCRMLSEEIEQLKLQVDMSIATEANEENEKVQKPNMITESDKKRPKLAIADVLIDLKIDAFVSADYIADEALRMDFYRRVVNVRNLDDYHDCYDELLDRYGEPDKYVVNLIKYCYIRAAAAGMGINSIKYNEADEVLRMDFSDKCEYDMEAMSILMSDKRFSSYLNLKMSSVKPALLYQKVYLDMNKYLDDIFKMFSLIEETKQKK